MASSDVHITQEGDSPNFGKVNLNQEALTNALSLALTADKYRVTFDGAVDNAFCVHTNETVIRFERDPVTNLCAHGPTACKTSKNSKSPIVQQHLNTVEENMKFHAPREIKRAKLARHLINALGSPSAHDLKIATAANAIADLPVTSKMWTQLRRFLVLISEMSKARQLVRSLYLWSPMKR